MWERENGCVKVVFRAGGAGKVSGMLFGCCLMFC